MQWLVEVCINRPVFTVMMMMAIIVLGILGFITLSIDRFPNVDFPTITVIVNNPGASPAEIETEITKKIEDQVNTISSIDSLTSTSSEGRSEVMIGFLLNKDVNIAAQEVKDKIGLIRNDLPITAEEPIVQKLDFDSAPVLEVALSSSLTAQELYYFADKEIRNRIENVEGVGDVTIVGGGEREIQIFLDPERMRAFNVTASDITLALQRQNQETPGGRVEQGEREITVRTIGKIITTADFNNIPIVKREGYSVLLKEVAEVKDGVKETRSLSFVNGIPAITLNVRKQSGENTLAIANLVKARLAEIQTTLPTNVKMQIIGDQTIFIQAAVSTVEEHLIVGSILACLVIYLFLWNFRMTIIAALAIPTSIIGTFSVMWVFGYTLNTITMLALTLMIGIVIDDAIVVLENIHRFIVEKGMSPFKAAVEGTREVSLAVMATSFSLLAVFVPVGFMGGLIGKFMSSFGLTASIAIAISLFVSFSLTPMLSSRWIKAEKHKPKNLESELPKTKSFFSKLTDFYVWMLQWSMKHRWVIVVMVILVLASNILLFSIIGMDFIPEDDESQFQVTVETVQGTTLVATKTIAERIAKEVRTMSGVTETLTTIGDSNDDSKVNKATIYIKLVDIPDRDLSQAELLSKTREMLKSYPSDIKTTVGAIDTVGGGGSNAEIQYLLLGPDTNKLAQYAEQITAKLKEVPEAIEVDTSLIADKPELRVTVDRKRAADLGVSVSDISGTLNILLTGTVASTFNAGIDQYDVRVRANSIYRQRIEDLRQMSVRSEKDEIIPLDQLVKIESGTAFSSIDRYNRQNQVTIFSNIAPGASASTVSTKLDAIIAELKLDPAYKVVAEGSSQNINDSIYYFGLAFAMSFIFMYMILASQFESYIHPITILLTLPLSIPFGVVSLLLSEQSLNLFVFLGILVLFGIVKKNAILQIDHTIGLRAKGMPRDEAIIEANRDRLRPILMTTLAFVAGMIPLLFGTGSGATSNRSIGTLVAGGQTFCLVLTLLAVPVFYSIFDDLGNHPIFVKISARWRLFRQNFKRRLRPSTTSVLVLVFLTFTTVNLINAQEKTAIQIAVQNVNKDKKTADTKEVGANSIKDNNPTSKIDYSRVGVQNDQQLPLSLQDAIRLALEQNNDIKAAETDVRIAEYNLRKALGGNDPIFTTENYYQYARIPSSSSFQTGSSITEKGFFSVTELTGKVTRFGSSYSAQFSNSKSSSDSVMNSFNPQIPTSLKFGYIQPLFRGLRIDESRRAIQVAKKNISLSDAQFREKVIVTISEIESAYWDLVYALKNLQVQQSGLRDAQAQFESNKRQVEQGVIAPVDITQAESQVVTFEQNVYAAKVRVTETENALKVLILPNRENPNWTRTITPTSEAKLEVPQVTLSEAVAVALQNRSELAQTKTSQEINQINSRYFKDQMKPQVDLFGNYTTQGLAGQPMNDGANFFDNSALTDRVNQLSAINNLPPLPVTVPPINNDLTGGYFKSLKGLLSNKYPTVQVGVRISLPIGNRQAEANLGSSLTEGTKLEYQLAQQKQNIEREIRNALESLNTNEKRWKLSIKARELAQNLYDSECRQLIAGTSTTYLILERQITLVTAQATEVQAQMELNKSISNLQRAIGTSLERNSVTLQPRNETNK